MEDFLGSETFDNFENSLMRSEEKFGARAEDAVVDINETVNAYSKETARKILEAMPDKQQWYLAPAGLESLCGTAPGPEALFKVFNGFYYADLHAMSGVAIVRFQDKLPCPSCKRWSLVKNGAQWDSMRRCLHEGGVVWMVYHQLVCRNCPGTDLC